MDRGPRSFRCGVETWRGAARASAPRLAQGSLGRDSEHRRREGEIHRGVRHRAARGLPRLEGVRDPVREVGAVESGRARGCDAPRRRVVDPRRRLHVGLARHGAERGGRARGLAGRPGKDGVGRLWPGRAGRGHLSDDLGLDPAPRGRLRDPVATPRREPDRDRARRTRRADRAGGHGDGDAQAKARFRPRRPRDSRDRFLMGFVFVTGGARSGKSDLAYRFGRDSGNSVTVIATATADDSEMAERIRRHRELRPPSWATTEEPLQLLAAVQAAPAGSFVIVDCLTLWVSCLTVLPVANSDGSPGARLGRAYCPAIGALVGLGAGAVLIVVGAATTPLLGAAAAVATLCLLTGAIHLDGLADSADGLLGRGDVAHRLEVMRDPRLGSYGVTAIAAVLLLDVAAISSISPARGLAALVIAGGLSRLAVLLVIVLVPYVRASGLGVAAWDSRRRGFDVVVGAVSAGVACALDWRHALIALPFVALTALVLIVLARKRVGGVTGDVCGATAELCQLAVLLVFAVR